MVEARHGWNTLEDYLLVVRHVVDDSPFVISDTLAIEDISPEAGYISGEIICHGEIILDVLKHFEIMSKGKQQYARTVRYSYNARYANGQEILRYDNAHARESTGHSTSHHKHDFGLEGETVTDIGPDWPYLSEVLDELKDLTWGKA